MNAILSTLLIFVFMGTVVLLRWYFLRRPAMECWTDPPGLRTMAVFSGDDPEFFRLDNQDEAYVGTRLFQLLCNGLVDARLRVVEQGKLQNAHRAYVEVDSTRFALVLEHRDKRWVASVELAPSSRAEQRHIELSQRVYAPPDSPELRRLLTALDSWRQSQEKLSQVGWHKKQRWVDDDKSDPAAGPIERIQARSASE